MILEMAGLLFWEESIFLCTDDRPQDAKLMVAVPFKIQHRVHHVLEHLILHCILLFPVKSLDMFR